jgi:hypothetical protein
MQWPRKLYDLEEIPPPHCWEEVKQAISNEPLSLGHSLDEWEVAPPAESWNLIAAEIRETQTLPRIDAARTITRRPLVAYAAAVVGLLLLASVLWYAFNNHDNGLNVRDLAAGLSYADSPAQAAPAQGEADSGKALANAGTPQDSGDSDKSQAISGSLPNPPEAIASAPSRATEQSVPVVSNISVSYADGNYIQLTEPDGDVTRVSYKLDRMVKAMHARNSNADGPQRQEWNRKLETWTNRMAQSTYIPSGGNFFDIAEFVEFLNKGQ